MLTLSEFHPLHSYIILNIFFFWKVFMFLMDKILMQVGDITKIQYFARLVTLNNMYILQFVILGSCRIETTFSL